MPLGILTDEQLAKEIGQSVPKINEQDIKRIESDLIKDKIEEAIQGTDFKIIPKVVDIKRGRGNQLEIPNEIRALVAEEVINGAPAKQVAKAFGVSESSVSAYKHDATSTTSYDTPNQELAKKNDSVRDAITDKARGRLMSALDAITDENISNAKVKDIASIAKDMSVIVKNMEENTPQNQTNTQVIIYRPRMRDEEDFDVITVNE
jgi:predicted transcriptional regulator